MDRLPEPAFDLRLWLSGAVDLGEMFWLAVNYGPNTVFSSKQSIGAIRFGEPGRAFASKLTDLYPGAQDVNLRIVCESKGGGVAGRHPARWTIYIYIHTYIHTHIYIYTHLSSKVNLPRRN
jgi:hypothetical protein